MGLFDFFKSKPAPAAQSTQTNFGSNKQTLNISKTPVAERLNVMKGNAEFVQKLSITKGITNKSRVGFIVDRSGSMDELYTSGEVQEVFEKIFPVALAFDDNQAIDLFAFHNKAYDLGEVTLNNFSNCINEKIADKLSYGGTEYAPIINMIVSKYAAEAGDPVYIIFLTDGDCGDKAASKSAIRAASKHGIFFQFVGIGRDSMTFLEELDELDGRYVDNANFFRIPKMGKISDHDLYNKLMGEYPEWLKLARAKNII